MCSTAYLLSLLCKRPIAAVGFAVRQLAKIQHHCAGRRDVDDTGGDGRKSVVEVLGRFNDQDLLLCGIDAHVGKDFRAECLGAQANDHNVDAIWPV